MSIPEVYVSLVIVLVGREVKQILHGRWEKSVLRGKKKTIPQKQGLHMLENNELQNVKIISVNRNDP